MITANAYVAVQFMSMGEVIRSLYIWSEIVEERRRKTNGGEGRPTYIQTDGGRTLNSIHPSFCLIKNRQKYYVDVNYRTLVRKTSWRISTHTQTHTHTYTAQRQTNKNRRTLTRACTHSDHNTHICTNASPAYGRK